ncbi:MAG: DUF692 domain-containing protein [Ramlibacter sp.]|nr:DUF692 domain-containing protein [Ramlibacter sp.]
MSLTCGPRLGLPDLGVGLGLRSQHVNQVLRERPAIDWFEVITENYLDNHGWQRHALRQVAEHYPVVLHGVSLSIGSADPLDRAYLASLRQLAKDIGARWVSDHLCWTGVAGQTTHDLLPLPLTERTLSHVVARIQQVQDVLQQPLVIENPSSYARFQADTLPEWEFIARMAGRAGCGLLLDVNNVYVSSVNHGFDAQAYIDALPAQRVVQMHLAGHRPCEGYILDTHDAPVSPAVWRLYRHAVGRTGPVSTLLEWDDHIPALDELHAEALKARAWLAPAEPAGSASTTHSPPHRPAGPPASQAAHGYPQLAGAEFGA